MTEQGRKEVVGERGREKARESKEREGEKESEGEKERDCFMAKHTETHTHISIVPHICPEKLIFKG